MNKNDIEDLLTRELDVLENAISDENRELAICSREEIWKLIDRLVEAGKADMLDTVLKEIEGLVEPDYTESGNKWAVDDMFLAGFNSALDILKNKLLDNKE